MADQTTKPNPAVPACLMTIFGASGDLTKRLLLPSIYNLAAAKVLSDDFQLLGVAMDDWNDDKFRDHISTTLKQYWGADADDTIVSWLAGHASYQSANFDEPASFDRVKATIERIEKDTKSGGNRLFYLAVAPSFIAGVTAQLSRTGVLAEDEGACWRRLIIEKPFGHDLESAISLNADLQKSLNEGQIYRIDHFAGKDAVQDLAVFRFSNAIFEPLWNRNMIDSVQITAAEIVGVEGRAAYYEKSGGLRDMVPNHMAELLSLVAMEPPVSFDSDHMRNKQIELLQSIRRMRPEDVSKFAVRGQYGPGVINGTPVQGYRQEPGVNPASTTDTYIAMKVEVDNWRWFGVPFYIRTGKRMSQAHTEIVVTFRQPPARLFPNAMHSNQAPNQLFFTLQPNPGIRLAFGMKAPGLETVVQRDSMDFHFPDGPFKNRGKGYERLLRDVILGNQTLFQRAEFVEEGWRMIEPILEAWQEPAKEEFPNYASGSAGPKAADDLLAVCGHSWNPLG